MGLFSRKKSEQTTRSTSRTTTSSEAQAAELRGRARRRLIGALVLVLTAIIVVPMLFDDTSTQQADTPLVLPAIVPPIPEPDLAAVNPPEYSVDEPVLVEGALQTGESTAADSASEAGLTTDATAPVVQQSPTDASEAGHTAGQPDVAPSQPDRASTPSPSPQHRLRKQASPSPRIEPTTVPWPWHCLKAGYLQRLPKAPNRHSRAVLCCRLPLIAPKPMPRVVAPA